MANNTGRDKKVYYLVDKDAIDAYDRRWRKNTIIWGVIVFVFVFAFVVLLLSAINTGATPLTHTRTPGWTPPNRTATTTKTNTPTDTYTPTDTATDTPTSTYTPTDTALSRPSASCAWSA